jgi:predicted transcriptional regulator YdeE
MEIKKLDSDIKVFYILAESFPNGVLAAHRKLHSLLPAESGRNFFGISYQNEKGDIIYKAAVEESYPGEAEKYGLETFIIKKGEYACETLIDWVKDESVVGKTFKKLLSDPRIDRNGYCLEMYLNNTDMECMVNLDPNKINKS